VDHLVVEGDLVGRPPPAFQLDADVAREPVGDCLPETSGLGEVVSNRAVLDRDHADSVVWRGDGLASPGVAARSPGARDQSNAAPSGATPFAWHQSRALLLWHPRPGQEAWADQVQNGAAEATLVEMMKSGLPIHARTGGATGTEAGPRSVK
jgi:hypothetical protein